MPCTAALTLARTYRRDVSVGTVSEAPPYITYLIVCNSLKVDKSAINKAYTGSRGVSDQE